MKLLLAIATVFLSAGLHAESLYDQRDEAAKAASAAHYHQIYSDRSQELITRMQERLQAMAASHGGITNFNFSCTPGNCVAGSTFLGYGSFDTADGALGCRIPIVGLDLIYCKGPGMTQCPEMQLRADCIDASGNHSSLLDVTAPRRHKRKSSRR